MTRRFVIKSTNYGMTKTVTNGKLVFTIWLFLVFFMLDILKEPLTLLILKVMDVSFETNSIVEWKPF
jgi:hypothetical protein